MLHLRLKKPNKALNILPVEGDYACRVFWRINGKEATIMSYKWLDELEKSLQQTVGTEFMKGA